MIRLERDFSRDLVEIRLQDLLQTKDLQRLNIDAKILMAGDTPLHMLVDARYFDGWENRAAAIEHFRFINNHHHKIQRLALIAGKQSQYWLAVLAGVFVNPQIKVFAAPKKARTWLATSAEPGLFILERDSENAIGIKVNGKIQAHAITTTVLPIIKERFNTHASVNLLLDMNYSNGMKYAACWEMIKFVLRYKRRVKRIAFIDAQQWLQHLTALLNPLVQNELRCFTGNQLESAWQWVDEV